MKGKDHVIAARVRLLFDNPFFGTLATGLTLRETDAVPTAATDGVSMLFNPEFTDKLSKAEMEFVIAHEVMHLVFLSHVRRGNRDPLVWNYATDYAINLVLKDENFSVLPDALLEEKYREWSSEKIYDYLMKNPEEQPQGTSWDVGSVMDAGSAGEGDGKEAAPMTAEQVKAVEAEMKGKIQAAAMGAKKAGNMPAGIERLINEICAPKANWRDILQRFVSEAAFIDWDYARCHTRQLQQYGVINPVIGGEALGKLSIIVDTSGSVDEEQLSQFAGEINDILENYECKVVVIYCDTQINRVDEYSSDDLPLMLHAVGGGGTLGKPAYDYVAEQISNSAAVIHYTDSYLFDWNEIQEPACPVLMACTEKHVDRDVPEWCELIDIS